MVPWTYVPCVFPLGQRGLLTIMYIIFLARLVCCRTYSFVGSASGTLRILVQCTFSQAVRRPPFELAAFVGASLPGTGES